MFKTPRLIAILAASGVLLLSACGSDEPAASSTSQSSVMSTSEMTTPTGTSEMTTPSSSEMTSTSEMPMSSSEMTSSETTMSSSEMPMSSSEEMAAGPAGPGCAAYVAAVPSGAGSVEGMAADPVATAASNNPLLTTLVKAVSGQLNPQVNLVSTLNGGEFTVFAPVDEAFAKIDAATISTLGTDAALLSSILTYHVIAGQIGLDAIVGTHETVQGGTLEVFGTPDALTVNGSSAVLCGGVKTANATVYLVDTVLMPPAM
jgi:uncharacterized surface protein with fasciclin (FAS1) repeats